MHKVLDRCDEHCWDDNNSCMVSLALVEPKLRKSKSSFSLVVSCQIHEKSFLHLCDAARGAGPAEEK